MFTTYSDLLAYTNQEQTQTTATDQDEQSYQSNKQTFLTELYQTEDPNYHIDIDIRDLTGEDQVAGSLQANRNVIIQQHTFYKQFARLLGVYDQHHAGILSLAISFGIFEQSILLAPLKFFDKVVDTPSLLLGSISTEEQQTNAKATLYSLKRALEEILFLLSTQNGLDVQNRKHILKELLLQLDMCLPGIQSTCTMLIADLKLSGPAAQVDNFKLEVLDDFHVKCIAERRESNRANPAHRFLESNSVHLKNNIIKYAASLGFVMRNRAIADFQDMFQTQMPISTDEKNALPNFISQHYTLGNLVERRIKQFKIRIKQICKELGIQLAPDGSMAYVDFAKINSVVLTVLKRYGFVSLGVHDMPVNLVQQSNNFYDELTTFIVVRLDMQAPTEILDNHLYICNTNPPSAHFTMQGKTYTCTIDLSQAIDPIAETASCVTRISFINLELALIKNLSAAHECTLHSSSSSTIHGLEIIPYAPNKCCIAFFRDGVTYDLANCSRDIRAAAFPYLDNEYFLIFLAHQLSLGNRDLLEDFIVLGRHKLDEWFWKSLYAIAAAKKVAGAIELLVTHQVSFFMQDNPIKNRSKSFLTHYLENHEPDLKTPVATLLITGTDTIKERIYALANTSSERLNIFIREYVAIIAHVKNKAQFAIIFNTLLDCTDGYQHLPESLQTAFMMLLLKMWEYIPKNQRKEVINKYMQHKISKSMLNVEFLKRIFYNANEAVLILERLIRKRSALPFVENHDLATMLTTFYYENKTPLYYAVNYARKSGNSDREIPALTILTLGSTRLSLNSNIRYLEENEEILNNPIQVALFLRLVDLAHAIYELGCIPAHAFNKFITKFVHNSRYAATQFLRHNNHQALHFMLEKNFVDKATLVSLARSECKVAFCLDNQLLAQDDIPPPPPMRFTPREEAQHRRPHANNKRARLDAPKRRRG